MPASTITLRDPNGNQFHIHVKEKMAGGVLVIEATVRTVQIPNSTLTQEVLAFQLVSAPAADGKVVALQAPTGAQPVTGGIPTPELHVPISPLTGGIPTPEVLALPAINL